MSMRGPNNEIVTKAMFGRGEKWEKRWMREMWKENEIWLFGRREKLGEKFWGGAHHILFSPKWRETWIKKNFNLFLI